jgi:hypothetical protein
MAMGCLGDPQQGVAVFSVVKKLPKATDKRILKDDLVMLKNKDSRAHYPEAIRLTAACYGRSAENEFNVSDRSTQIRGPWPVRKKLHAKERF